MPKNEADATEPGPADRPTEVLALEYIEEVLDAAARASRDGAAGPPSIPRARAGMGSTPPTRSRLSCSADEIRRDAASAVEALDGLRLAARREAVYGRSIARNQHVTSGHFASLWRLSADLQSRGFRLSGVTTLDLIGVPEGMTPQQDRELRNAYLDLCSQVIEVDGPQVDQGGLFPHVDDDFLTRFADVAVRLQGLADSLAATSAGGTSERAIPAVESPRALRTFEATAAANPNRRDGSKEKKVKLFFNELKMQFLERLEAGETPELNEVRQQDIAKQLRVSRGSVSRIWKEVSQDKAWTQLIRRGLVPWHTTRRGQVKPVDANFRPGFRFADGTIEARVEPDPDDED